MEFVDREPRYPNRYKIIAEDGTEHYVTLERADEPIRQGTPINAATFNEFLAIITAEVLDGKISN